MAHFSGGALDKYKMHRALQVPWSTSQPQMFLFQAWTICCTALSPAPTGCSTYGAIQIKKGFCHMIEKNGFRYYGMLYNKCLSAIESLGLKLVDKRIEQIYNQDTTPGCFYDPQKQRAFYQRRTHQNGSCVRSLESHIEASRYHPSQSSS